MNYKLINLTPHVIHVLMRDNKILTIESSGNARCEIFNNETLKRIKQYYEELKGEKNDN